MLGIRDEDEGLTGLRGAGVPVWETSRLRAEGSAGAARTALAHLERGELDGFWVHVDADILDPQVMPAVDTPSPGGIGYEDLVELVAPFAASPRCVGIEVTVFDPDLDADGRLARELTDALTAAIRRGR